MENNESIQMPEINHVDEATANTTMVVEQVQELTDERQGRRTRLPQFRLGGTVEQVSMMMAVGMTVAMLTGILWTKILASSICAFAFLVPIVIRSVSRRTGISPEKVCSILKKRGFAPEVNGDEIRWISKGKECILRVWSHCQVEIAREYDLPPIPAAIEGNEKAALETMKEVYLAKVSVRMDNGSGRLAFSTESLCASAKEFSAYLPMCLEILDLAEDRQKEHIMEIRNAKGEDGPRKIGFLHPDGTIR